MVEQSVRALALRLVRVLLGLSALVFIFLVARDLLSKFEPGRISISPSWLVLSLVPATGALVAQFAAWKALIERFSGRAVPSVISSVLYLDSQMARYTPGKVGLLAVRVAGAAELGIPARVLASTLLIELASWTSVGLSLGLGLLVAVEAARPGTLPSPGSGSLQVLLKWGTWALAVGALTGTVLLCTLRRRRFPPLLNRLLLGPLADEVDPQAPLAPWVLPAWHILHWTLWVLAGACLATAVGAEPLVAVVVGASLCVAIVFGFLALVAPAGAGVREAVLAALLSPALGAAVALSLGLLARGVALLAEVLLWLSARWVRARRDG